MCGIAGIYNSTTPELDRSSLHNMAQAIAYRGPDAQGILQNDNTTFAHRRLAIIDLDPNANQPMTDAANTCMITFNGEIYNFRELRADLIAQGCKFRTNSDTEVILELYRQHGIEALSKLDGMFAFAVYDKKNRELYLMRDPVGKKPLYYWMPSPGEVVFASTLAALKKHPRWQGTLRPEAIEDFLAYEYIPGNQSVYRNVFQLPPGSFMRCTPDGTMQITHYWQVDYGRKVDLSLKDASELLREKLQRAAAKRLIADVPCGLFLSGGIDSAITAMLSAQHAGETLNAFTIGFDQKNYDERELASATVRWVNKHTKYGLQHHTQTVNCQSFEALKLLAQVYGEPFADFSLLPTYFLSKFAGNTHKVVISGDGADELFGGYERYYAMAYCKNLRKLVPGWVIRLMSQTADALFRDGGKRSRASRLCRFLRLAALPEGERYAMTVMQSCQKHRHALFGERLKDIGNHQSRDFIKQALQKVTTCDWKEAFAECDLHTYLPGDILTKVDRASMAASLEVRSPFLDKEVIEFAATLPFAFKQQNSSRKIILKNAMHDYLAPEVINQRKRGFAVPIGSWFRNEWKSLLAEHLTESLLVKDNWMDRQALAALIAEHNSFKRDHSSLLGALLMLELFLEQE